MLRGAGTALSRAFSTIRKAARPSVTTVVGTQWGDEGKGKLVDVLVSSSTLSSRIAHPGHLRGVWP
jgi:hypothetical protein